MNIFNMNNVIIQGNRVGVLKSRIVVDGKDVTDQVGKPKDGILEIRVIEGVIEHLQTDASVTCGDVRGSVDAGGSIVAGDVGGNANAGGTVKCGDVGGNASAGGAVTCGTVGGHVSAGGSVRHG